MLMHPQKLHPTKILWKVEVDDSGNYTGHTLALMEIATEVLLDNAFYILPIEQLEYIMKIRFAEKFPYYKKEMQL